MRSRNPEKSFSGTDEVPWHGRSAAEIFAALESGPSGLTEAEAHRRLAVFGPNTLPSAPRPTARGVLFRQFRSPFSVILGVAAGIAWLLGDAFDAAFIIAAIAVNVLFGFVQEWRAERSLEALKRVLRAEATVVRDGVPKRVPTEAIVVGDVLVLAAGERVAADARILDAESLEVNEAPLTGESLPVPKTADVLPPGTVLLERRNMVFAGTAVTRGEGTAIVVATGSESEIGKIARTMSAMPEEETPLEERLRSLAQTISRIVVGLAAAIFLVGILRGIPALEIFMTAAAVAVAAVPEGLIVAVTVILAIGMSRLVRKRALVRRLRAAETLGSVTVICVDKTGTVTEGRMRVVEVLPADGDASREEAMAHILHLSVLANEAWIEEAPHRDGHTIGPIVGEATDAAILTAALEAGLHEVIDARRETVLDRLPFSSEHQFIAALADLRDRRERIIAVKGAWERIAPACSRVLSVKGEVSLAPQARGELTRRHNELSTQGLRVIAVAARRVPPTLPALPNPDEILRDLAFVGFLALEDPVRPDAADALALARQAGVKTMLITGDHVLTARRVAAAIGIPDAHIIDGRELAELSDAELADRLSDGAVFARTLPAQKLRIVEVLKARGEVVAMTGDGINDAPAMKSADIGIAIGSGTEVARDSAELVLLDDRFATIVTAIREGRVIFENIRKVVLFLFIDTFSEVILIAGSVLSGFPLPLLPAQILFINLIEDGPPTFALAFEPGEAEAMRRSPRSPRERIMNREMLVLIFGIGLATDLALFGLYLWLLRSGVPLETARTMIFAMVGLDSFTQIFSIRSLRTPVWRLNPFSNPWLIGAVLVGVGSVVAGVLFPPLQRVLRTTTLSPAAWLLVGIVAILNAVLVEVVKFAVRRVPALAK